MPGPTTGHRCKAYRNTGTAAVPIWDEIQGTGDVSISDLTRAIAELKRRGNDFTKGLASLIQLIRVTITLTHGVDTTTYTALRTAFFAGTATEYAILDGDVTVSGTQGLRFPAFVANFPWNQPLEDVVNHDMQLATAYWESPTGTEVDPSWMLVA